MIWAGISRRLEHLVGQAENETYHKIKMVHKGERITAYGVLYCRLIDVSGIGFAKQARMLMHPSPPKQEEHVAEHVEMWRDKKRRLEAHGEEFKLAPLLNINALRMLRTRKAK